MDARDAPQNAAVIATRGREDGDEDARAIDGVGTRERERVDEGRATTGFVSVGTIQSRDEVFGRPSASGEREDG